MISHKSSCFCVKEWCKVLATLPSLSFLLMGWMLEEINTFAAFNTCPFVCQSVCLLSVCLAVSLSVSSTPCFFLFFFRNLGLSCLFTRLLLLLVHLFAILSVFMMFLKYMNEKVFCVLSSKLFSIIGKREINGPNLGEVFIMYVTEKLENNPCSPFCLDKGPNWAQCPFWKFSKFQKPDTI